MTHLNEARGDCASLLVERVERREVEICRDGGGLPDVHLHVEVLRHLHVTECNVDNDVLTVHLRLEEVWRLLPGGGRGG